MSEPDSETISSTQNEVIIIGPGKIIISGETHTDLIDPSLKGSKVDVKTP